jgi:phenylpropionate dioxygenase-like ring-hydroxylating dioxygenase large terminal subunit
MGNLAAGTAFARADVVSPSWYPLLASRALRPGQATSVEALGRRWAFFRDENGAVACLNARCAHLGADLGQGTVRRGCLRCPFHGWQYTADGRLRAGAGGRPGAGGLGGPGVAAWPVLERWGFVWVFNRPAPLFDLPEPSFGARVICGPERSLPCHGHLLIANGLDLSHYEVLHDFVMTAPPRWQKQPPYGVRVDLQGRPMSRWLRLATGELRASFTTVGGSLAWLEIAAPLQLQVLFVALPDGRGNSRSRAFFFVPPPVTLNLVRSVALMTMLLRDEHVLGQVDFQPNFVASDAPLQAFAAVVDGLEEVA